MIMTISEEVCACF